MCNNMAKAFDRARVRCVLPERSVSSRVIIISGEFRQNSPQMLFVDHNQMIGTLGRCRWCISATPHSDGGLLWICS
jgi:hypothetical protein